MKGCTALPLGVRGDPKCVEGPGEMRGPAAQTDHPSGGAEPALLGNGGWRESFPRETLLTP